jgi:hypothetical protein
MVDIVIKTRKITREQIVAAVGGNPRLVKLIESLAHDVTVSIPDSVSTVEAQSVFSLYPADGSKSIATQTERVAQQTEMLIHTARRSSSIADQADAVALQVEILTQTVRRYTSELAIARIEVEQLRSELFEARARSMSAANMAQNSANDALTILLGA